MESNTPAASTNELQEVPRINERALEVREVLGDIIERVKDLTADIKDDEHRDRLTARGVELKTRILEVEGLRKRHYNPFRDFVRTFASVYDDLLKPAYAVKEAAESAVGRYNEHKRREAERLRLEAEEKARKAREEEARLKAEAEAAERRAKAEAEARIRARQEEERRREEAKLEAERQRLRAESERIARESAELERRRKEEEDARIAKALEADRVAGAAKADAVLDRAAPLPAPAPVIPAGPTPEELAAKAKAQQEEADRKADYEAEQAAAKARQEAEKATAEEARQKQAKAAQEARDAEAAAKATAAAVSRPDSRTVATGRAVYRIKEPAAFVKAIADNCERDRGLLEYLGFDPENLAGFRSTALTKDITKLKTAFVFPGVEVWMESKTSFRANDAKPEADKAQEAF